MIDEILLDAEERMDNAVEAYRNALATVRTNYAALGTPLLVEHTVEFERTTVDATVVEKPFFDPERKRS